MANVPTVLIVDDDPAIRKMLTEMLALEGYPTEVASNGREALEILAHSGPRIVLLDYLMPEVNGRGVLEALEAQPEERARHHIILVSAFLHLDQTKELRVEARLESPSRCLNW